MAHLDRDFLLVGPLVYNAALPFPSGRYLPIGLLALDSMTNLDASHLDLDFDRLLTPALVGIFAHVFFKRREFPFQLLHPLIIGLLKPSLFRN